MFGKKKEAIEAEKPKSISEEPVEKMAEEDEGKSGFQNNPTPVAETHSPNKEVESKRPIERNPTLNTSNKEKKPLAAKSVKPAPRKIGVEGVPLEIYTDKGIGTQIVK